MIESYDLPVFRRVLHVAISPTLEELREGFRFDLLPDDCEDSYSELDENVYDSFLKKGAAFVIRVIDKKNNRFGYLVHIEGSDDNNIVDFIDIISHEANHVNDQMLLDVGVKEHDTEIRSLIIGYVSGMIYKTYELWKKPSE